MFLESYCICDVTNTVTLHLWRHKTIIIIILIVISDKHRNSIAVNIYES